MNILQEDIIKYTKTDPAILAAVPCNEFDVVVEYRDGTRGRLTGNLYGDIMNADTKQIIAVSDVPHSLTKCGHIRPTKWAPAE